MRITAPPNGHAILDRHEYRKIAVPLAKVVGILKALKLDTPSWNSSAYFGYQPGKMYMIQMRKIALAILKLIVILNRVEDNSELDLFD